MRLPGRVTVQVVGWQLAFETPKRNASHVVCILPVLTLDSECVTCF